MQSPDGTYPVYEGSEIDPDTTTGVAFLMRELYGEDDEVYKRGKERFEEYLTQLAEDAERGYHLYQGKREENDIYHLTHLLHESVIEAGYDLRDLRPATEDRRCHPRGPAGRRRMAGLLDGRKRSRLLCSCP